MMEFKKIFSGKGKIQILHLGYRLSLNQEPRGPHKTCYFKCVEKKCPARMSTTGDPKGEMKIKFHDPGSHNHEPDVSRNIVSSSLFEFREKMRANPECTPSTLYDEIVSNAMKSAEKPSDLAKKMPSFSKIKDQAYRARYKSRSSAHHVNLETLRKFKRQGREMKKSKRLENKSTPQYIDENINGIIDADQENRGGKSREVDKLEFEVFLGETSVGENRTEKPESVNVKEEPQIPEEFAAPELIAIDESNSTPQHLETEDIYDSIDFDIEENTNFAKKITLSRKKDINRNKRKLGQSNSKRDDISCNSKDNDPLIHTNINRAHLSNLPRFVSLTATNTG